MKKWQRLWWVEDQQEDKFRCQVEENLSKKGAMAPWFRGHASSEYEHTKYFSHSFIHNLSSLFPLLDDTYYLSKTLFLIVSLPPRGIGEAWLLFCFSASGSRDLNQPVLASSIWEWLIDEWVMFFLFRNHIPEIKLLPHFLFSLSIVLFCFDL